MTQPRIPQRIIQTWKSRTLPRRYRRFQKKLRKLHPEWDVQLFTDDEMHAFVREEYPQYVEAYEALPNVVCQTDLFRILAVHKLGGFYCDLDVLFVKPLDELREHACVFPFQSNSDAYFAALFRSIDCIGQYAFGAEAGHPFLIACADAIARSVLDPEWALVPNDEAMATLFTPLEPPHALPIYYTSGPSVITRAFIENPEARAGVKLLSAFDQENNRKLYYCFGPYAVHAMHGTWKGDKPWYIPILRHVGTSLAMYLLLGQMKNVAARLDEELPALPEVPPVDARATWIPRARMQKDTAEANEADANESRESDYGNATTRVSPTATST